MNVSSRPLRIAVVGSGVTGLSAAWLLAKRHSVTIYEAEPRLGGHSNTIALEHAGQSFAVDTGFIVYNERTYPNLIALLHHLGVGTHATDMSFAVSAREGALEYSGSGLRGLFGGVAFGKPGGGRCRSLPAGIAQPGDRRLGSLERLFDQRLDEEPGAVVARLFLAPDDLFEIGHARQADRQWLAREGIELFEPKHGGVFKLRRVAGFDQVIADLA